MRKSVCKLIALLGFFAASGLFTSVGHAEVFQGEEIEVELVAETSNVAPGQTLWLAVRLKPTPGWHTYSKWPGDSGDATRIHEWQLPAGATVGEIQWPIPTWLPFQGSDLVTYSYKSEVFLPVAVSVPQDYSGDSFAVSAHVEWQVCDEICLIGNAVVSNELPVVPADPAIDPQWSQAFSETRARLPLSDHGIEAAYAMGEERVSFAFITGDPLFQNAREAWFFPEERRILKPGPLRQVDLDPGLIEITHNLHRRPLRDLQQLGGLLAVEDVSGNQRGFLIQAQSRSEQELASLVAVARGADAGSGGNAGEGPGLMLVIVFALLGGLILNLMPCVFPVLSLKVLSFASSADSGGRQQKLHGLSYTLGIVLTFMLLASLLLALRAGGEAVGWAFQLQSPGFISLIIILFFTMGLSLSGLYEFGTGFMGIGANLTQQHGLKGSFFTGVLATLVASPCTAPFMGAALGFALSQSWLVAMIVFIFLGLGMALPFLLLSFSPALLKFMPKPGQWMVRFKEFMAFPLYATALYFLWVLGMQVGINGVALVVGICLLVAFAMWLAQQRRTAAGVWRGVTLALCLLSLVAAASLLMSPLLSARSGGSGLLAGSASSGEALEEVYVPFSSQLLAELRAEGRPVFVNMTAAWCITCLFNEEFSLSTARVQEAMRDMDITYMKGDWTNQDPEISRVLDEFNRPSVPLYILYPADPAAQPVLLPQTLTPSLVIEAFNKHV